MLSSGHTWASQYWPLSFKSPTQCLSQLCQALINFGKAGPEILSQFELSLQAWACPRVPRKTNSMQSKKHLSLKPAEVFNQLWLPWLSQVGLQCNYILVFCGFELQTKYWQNTLHALYISTIYQSICKKLGHQKCIISKKRKICKSAIVPSIISGSKLSHKLQSLTVKNFSLASPVLQNLPSISYRKKLPKRWALICASAKP